MLWRKQETKNWLRLEMMRWVLSSVDTGGIKCHQYRLEL